MLAAVSTCEEEPGLVMVVIWAKQNHGIWECAEDNRAYRIGCWPKRRMLHFTATGGQESVVFFREGAEASCRRSAGRKRRGWVAER